MCSDTCKQYPINVCGDGYQSNGPDNLDGREECDDGNNIDGDGCSSTCRIEYGYECPYWGRLCDKKCGNGVVDPPYEIAAGVWRTEQCDLGDNRAVNPSVSYLSPANDPRPVGYNRNSDALPDREHACSTTCQVRGTHFWDCKTDAVSKVSTCYYLCGNKWLDLVGGTPKSGYAGGSSYTTGYGLTVNEPCDLFT